MGVFSKIKNFFSKKKKEAAVAAGITLAAAGGYQTGSYNTNPNIKPAAIEQPARHSKKTSIKEKTTQIKQRESTRRSTPELPQEAKDIREEYLSIMADVERVDSLFITTSTSQNSKSLRSAAINDIEKSFSTLLDAVNEGIIPQEKKEVIEQLKEVQVRNYELIKFLDKDSKALISIREAAKDSENLDEKRRNIIISNIRRVGDKGSKILKRAKEVEKRIDTLIKNLN